MNRLESYPPLLLALELMVKRDGRPPGFAGRLAVGVSSADMTRWWFASFGDRPRTAFFEVHAPDADCTIRFDLEDAVHVLETGQIHPGAELSGASGDRAVLERFVGRYLAAKSWVGVRAAGST